MKETMAYLYPTYVKYKKYTLSDKYKLEYKTTRFQLYQLVDNELEKLDAKYKQVCENLHFYITKLTQVISRLYFQKKCQIFCKNKQALKYTISFFLIFLSSVPFYCAHINALSKRFEISIFLITISTLI